MTTAVCHSVTLRCLMSAEIPSCVRARGVTPDTVLAIGVATEVVEAQTKLEVVCRSAAVPVRMLTCPLLALLPTACVLQATSVITSIGGGSIMFVAHVSSWFAELPT